MKVLILIVIVLRLKKSNAQNNYLWCRFCP